MSSFLSFRNISIQKLIRGYATANRIKLNQYPKTRRQLQNKPAPFVSFGESIKAKSYLRFQKPYAPPENVREMVHEICNSLEISCSGDHELSNSQEKFHLLNECFAEFNHSVPNSGLFEIQTIDDVINFYSAAIDTSVPLDKMKHDLPKNLHLVHDYKRFHPDDDQMFGGQTAFPKSSTIVTGLKARKKYSGFEAKKSWY